MTHENWQHRKSQHVTPECLADFFVVTFIQTGKLSTFQEHILFTATAWGVVEALIQDNFWLLLCHKCLSLKDKCKDVGSYQESGAFLWSIPKIDT